MCIFFGQKIKGLKIKNAFFSAENEKDKEIRSASVLFPISYHIITHTISCHHFI